MFRYEADSAMVLSVCSSLLHKTRGRTRQAFGFGLVVAREARRSAISALSSALTVSLCCGTLVRRQCRRYTVQNFSTLAFGSDRSSVGRDVCPVFSLLASLQFCVCFFVFPEYFLLSSEHRNPWNERANQSPATRKRRQSD